MLIFICSENGSTKKSIFVLIIFPSSNSVDISAFMISHLQIHTTLILLSPYIPFLEYFHDIFFILCLSVFCLHACVCTMCTWCSQRPEERVELDLLELELEAVVRCRVGAGN